MPALADQPEATGLPDRHRRLLLPAGLLFTAARGRQDLRRWIIAAARAELERCESQAANLRAWLARQEELP